MLFRKYKPDNKPDNKQGQVSARRTISTLSGELKFYAHDASTFVSRLRGMHALRPFRASDALIIRPCKAVHTIGLNHAIDVFFLDSRGVILKLVTLAPGRFAVCFRAALVVEALPGSADQQALHMGQRLVIS